MQHRQHILNIAVPAHEIAGVLHAERFQAPIRIRRATVLVQRRPGPNQAGRRDHVGGTNIFAGGDADDHPDGGVFPLVPNRRAAETRRHTQAAQFVIELHPTGGDRSLQLTADPIAPILGEAIHPYRSVKKRLILDHHHRHGLGRVRQ